MRLAFERLSENAARAMLTVSGIVTGALVLAVVLPVTLETTRMEHAAREMSSRQLFAVQQGNEILSAQSQEQISDTSNRLQEIPNVDKVFPVVVVPYVLHSRESHLGAPTYIFDKTVYDETGMSHVLSGIGLTEGRDQTAVVGADFAQLSGKSVGTEISLYGSAYRISGVLTKTFTFYDQGIFISRHNASALLSQVLQTRADIGLHPGETGFLLTLAAGANVDVVVALVNQFPGIRASDPRPQLRLAASTLAIFSLIVLGVGAVSLVSGALAIANMMAWQVVERTREIGLRRAVGARRADIFVEILSESLLLGVCGASVGVVVGILVDRYLNVEASRVGVSNLFTLGPGLAIFCVAAPAILCACASLVPALQASQLEPHDALRSTF